MTAAQATLKAAAVSMAAQVGNTTQLRDALRGAGVDTRNLADAEQRLIATANQSTGAVNTLTAAYKKHGAAVESSGKSLAGFLSGGRTTLSLTQRLKGELLALAAAYVGLQGAISTAGSALDAVRTKQKIQSGLLVAFGGDTALAAQELLYLREVSDRIGISFKEAAPAYAKLSIATRGFGLSLQETRFIFESFAIASKAAGLSAADFEGVLKAVEQMFSKGKISAEELRGQLGDRLPGAFAAAAKGAQMTTEEFTKALELGNISADTVINIARVLAEQSGANADSVAKLVESENKFKNAVFDFQLALAEGGFLDAYTKFLKELAAVLQSEEGKNFAQVLSNAFTTVIDVMRFLIQHTEQVKIALSALAGLLVAKWFLGLATSIVAVSTAIGGLFTALGSMLPLLIGAGTAAASAGTAAAGAATGVGLFRIALMSLARALPVIGAVVLAIETAMWAYKKLNAAKAESEGKGGSRDVTGILEGGPGFAKKGGSFTADTGTGATAGARAAKRIEKELEDSQKKLDKDRKSANVRSAKEQLAERADLIREEFNLKRDAAKREVTDEVAQKKILKTIDEQQNQALLTDQIKFNNEHAKSGASAAKSAAEKRITLSEQVKNELLRIEDELAKDLAALDKDSSFEDRRITRIEAISHAYDKLKKTIASLSVLDKAGAAEATKQLDIYIKKKQVQEDIKVTGEKVKALEKELADQQQLRQQGLEKEKALYDAGLLTQQDFLRNSAEITRAGDTAVTQAAVNLQKFADSVVATKKGLLSPTEISDISVKTTTATAKASNPQQAIDDANNKAQIEAIDAVVAKRSAAEELYAKQFELRMIDEDTYAKKVNDNAELYKGKLLELIGVLVQQMEAQRALGLLEDTLNAEKLAALDAFTTLTGWSIF